MTDATAGTSVSKPLRQAPVLPEHVKVWEHTNSVFWWPVAVLPPILWGLLSLGWVGDQMAAWWFIGILAMSMLAVSVNLSLTMSIIVLLVVGISWISILLAEAKMHIFIFAPIGQFLSSLDIHYNVALGNIIGSIAAFLFFWSIGHAKVDGRWHFRQNDFEHFRAMTGDGSKARAGKTIRTQYRDLLKLALGFGCGNIVILSGTASDKVEVEINNIFFLFHRWRKIATLISSMRTNEIDAVTAAHAADEN